MDNYENLYPAYREAIMKEGAPSEGMLPRAYFKVFPFWATLEGAYTLHYNASKEVRSDQKKVRKAAVSILEELGLGALVSHLDKRSSWDEGLLTHNERRSRRNEFKSVDSTEQTLGLLKGRWPDEYKRILKQNKN